ncbi:hypothetical protein [Campylobacter upsaliensis]|uniref:Integral membrane protein n=1 Tax=Campylobacter upsaliensis TaxID=28080 RepID=A0A381EK53_CAMUP|nr:hypothetical protein [Campylobacter upsaliensis]MCR2101427.1 hypothetical protein [Campylobacter upsaliensis]SUX27395.1 integral membrane protein [Campylobacter upsaliensis]
MDFNTVLMSIGDKLPRDGVASVTLKDKFEKLSEESQKNAITQLSVLNLKSPALVFWVGTFLLGALGVGRFMIVDMFLVGKKLRKKNYEKISAVFDNLK